MEKYETGFTGENESFVFYSSYWEVIKQFPESERLKALETLLNYGLYNQIPDVDNLPLTARVAYIASYSTIRSSLEKRKKTSHGLSGNQNAKKGPTCRKCVHYQSCHENKIDFAVCDKYTEQNKTTDKTKQNNNVNVNVNVNDNVNVNGEGNVNELYLSLPQKNYGEKIFSIWNDAGLPCCKSNMINFLQRDFKNALESLKGYNSGEVIEAAKNYVHEFKSSDSFVDQSISFDSFVASKFFNKCLPDNYQHSNFVKFADKKLQDSIPDYDKPRPGKKTFFRDALEELNKGELKI